MIKNKKVRKALIDAELSITNLSKVTGYTREHLSIIINGHKDSLRVKKVIALALNKDFKDLWEADVKAA